MNNIVNKRTRLWIFSGLFIAAVALLISALVPEPVPEQVVLVEQAAYIPPPTLEPAQSPIGFTDVSEGSGIDYRHFNGASLSPDGTPTRYMPETMGPGVALLDYDRDGDLDIFVTNSSHFSMTETVTRDHFPRLYRNEGDWRFSDATEAAGLDIVSYGMGVAVADYDGDTYPDLLLTAWGEPRLLRNRGDGSFEDVTNTRLPVAEKEDEFPRWSTGAVFFDADGDLDLDIFLADYVRWSPQSDLFATMDGRHKSYATPDIYTGGSSRLYLQDNGRFSDASAQAGLLNDDGKSLGLALWDFNDDGLMDIVVSNDTQPNFLYYNLGEGRFEDRALQAGIAYDANGRTRAGMGIDVADVANDGHVCIAIGNFSGEPVSIFRREGSSFFRESSQQAGVAEPSYLNLTFGLLFADFDLDGWQDLLLANGHIEPEIGNVDTEISYRQNLLLLGNRGDGRFENWSDTAGAVFQRPLVGRGLAVGDIDGDGDLDAVVTENAGPLHLLRNDKPRQGSHYVRVQLQGRAPNTDAIGARLELLTPSGAETLRQQRFVRSGSSYLSQSEMVQTFGVGKTVHPGTLRVTWPDGQRDEFVVREYDTTLTISRDKGVAQAGVP